MSAATELIPGAAGVKHAGAWWAKQLYHVKRSRFQLAEEYEAIQRAGEKWRINPIVLWGVYGAETAHGSDVKTSSTGARGPFQFEPATARTFGYPENANVTGVTDMRAFAKQADAAAHYLSTLLPGGKGETSLMKPGTSAWAAAWDKALKIYSGGGYGYATVKRHAGSAPAVMGTQGANQTETEAVESTPMESEDVWAKLQALALTSVLLLAGGFLVVYGILVAVRPHENALAVPRPRDVIL